MQREACTAVTRVFGAKHGDGNDGPPREPGNDDAGGGAAAKRATVVLPSGAGKTVFSLRVAEALRSARVRVRVRARVISSLILLF